jgi:glycosyltransferase involved in cell wall biosynthesis
MKKEQFFDEEFDLSKTCFLFLGRKGAGTRDLTRLRARYIESKFVSLRDDGIKIFFKNVMNARFVVYIHASPWVLFFWTFSLLKKQFIIVHNSPDFKSNTGIRGVIDSLILNLNIFVVKNCIFISQHVAAQYSPNISYQILSNKKFVDVNFTKNIIKLCEDLKPTIFFFGRYLPYKNLEKFVNLSKYFIDFDFYIYSNGSPFQNSTNLHVVRSWISEGEVDYIYKKHDILILPYAETTQSGPFYLAMEYNKIVVAPKISGFKEYFDYSGLILYEPNNEVMLRIGLVEAIKKFRSLGN